jgi:hypothetical protein
LKLYDAEIGITITTAGFKVKPSLGEPVLEPVLEVKFFVLCTLANNKLFVTDRLNASGKDFENRQSVSPFR